MEFIRSEHATYAPSMCLCGSAAGPFVDTLMQKPAVGRIYLCHRCVHTASRTLGGLDSVQRSELEQALDQALSRVAMLTAEVAAETANKVVSLEDVFKLISPSAPVGTAA